MTLRVSKHVGVAYCNFYNYCNRHLRAFVGGIKNNLKMHGTTINVCYYKFSIFIEIKFVSVVRIVIDSPTYTTTRYLFPEVSTLTVTSEDTIFTVTYWIIKI